MKIKYVYTLILIVAPLLLLVSHHALHHADYKNYFTSKLIDEQGIIDIKGVELTDNQFPISQKINTKTFRNYYQDFDRNPVCLSMWIGANDPLDIDVLVGNQSFSMSPAYGENPITLCNTNLIYEHLKANQQMSIRVNKKSTAIGKPIYLTLGKSDHFPHAMLNSNASEFVLPYRLTITRPPLPREVLAYIIVIFFASLIVLIIVRVALMAAVNKRS